MTSTRCRERSCGSFSAKPAPELTPSGVDGRAQARGMSGLAFNSHFRRVSAPRCASPSNVHVSQVHFVRNTCANSFSYALICRLNGHKAGGKRPCVCTCGPVVAKRAKATPTGACALPLPFRSNQATVL